MPLVWPRGLHYLTFVEMQRIPPCYRANTQRRCPEASGRLSVGPGRRDAHGQHSLLIPGWAGAVAPEISFWSNLDGADCFFYAQFTVASKLKFGVRWTG